MLIHLNGVQHPVIPWIVTLKSPLTMGFSRQAYWSGLSFLPPGDLPNPGIKPVSPVSLALQVDSLPIESLGKFHEDRDFVLL